jgi:hypothetical protein
MLEIIRIKPRSPVSGNGRWCWKKRVWPSVKHFGMKPEQTNRVDFNFYVENDVVSIVRRKRGAPLDKMVAELMIFANSTWGKLMADHGIPGIYRAQGVAGGRGQGNWTAHAGPYADACSTASGTWCGSVCVEYITAAPLHRSDESVADHRLCATRHHRTAGGAVQTERC